MTRFALRMTGHAMLVGFLLSVAVVFQNAHTAPAFRTAVTCAAISLAGWVGCLVAVMASDWIAELLDRAARVDPYEAHPKMSPSVQAAHRPAALARRRG